MKGLTTTAMAILVGLALWATPSTSRAADDVVDCSAGCLIMTCNASGSCTIWECNATGCHAIGEFRRLPKYMQQSKVSTAEGLTAEMPKPGATVCEFEREPCAIKVCTNGQCEVSIFDGMAFVPAAVVGDIDAVVERAQRELKQPDRFER